jgi:hypothetical protein
VVDSLRFHFEARQAPWRHRHDFRPKQQALADGLANAFSEALAPALGLRLNFNENLCQGPWLAHLDPVLGHFGKITYYRLQSAGVYIIAANMD